jgi:hypothetical protein
MPAVAAQTRIAAPITAAALDLGVFRGKLSPLAAGSLRLQLGLR